MNETVTFDIDLLDEDLFNDVLEQAIKEHWGIRPGDVRITKVPPRTYQIKAAVFDRTYPVEPVQPEWLDRIGIWPWIARLLGKLLRKPYWGKRAKYPPVDYDEEIIQLEICRIGTYEIAIGYGPRSNVLALGDRRMIQESPKKLTPEVLH